jgi:hypothetical protein
MNLDGDRAREMKATIFSVLADDVRFYPSIVRVFLPRSGGKFTP